jgi:hypothetical protein
VHYLIFIPTTDPAPGVDMLRRVGLEGLIDGNMPAELDIRATWQEPEQSQQGVLFSWISPHGASSPLEFSLAKQLWHKAPPDPTRKLAAGRYWFGTDCAHSPMPNDMLRAQMPSRMITLGDGNQWGIPIAKQLPHSWGVDPATGQFARTPADPYGDFCKAAEGVYGSFRSASGLQVTIGDAWDYVCQALAVNYRITPEIVSFLGLINDSNFLQVIEATIDLDLIREAEDEKKN